METAIIICFKIVIKSVTFQTFLNIVFYSNNVLMYILPVHPKVWRETVY